MNNSNQKSEGQSLKGRFTNLAKIIVCFMALTFSFSQEISACAPPPTPATMHGPAFLCNTSTASFYYRCDTATGATTYTWTVTGTGWTSVASTLDSILVTPGTGNAIITVTADDTCGSSNPLTFNVTIVNGVPATPSPIVGASPVCRNSAHLYYVNNDTTVISYTWTLPFGWTGTSAIDSIHTTAGFGSGNIIVKANNACGASLGDTLAIIVIANLPATPGPMSGPTPICANNTGLYYVALVANTSYNWTLPGGWSGTSTTDSIHATAGTTGGTISVSATNVCGTSATPRTMVVTVVTTPPNTPVAILGNSTVCVGGTQIFGVAPDTMASSYTWTLPLGWTGTSIRDSISTMAGPNAGTITVTANNNCGSSAAQTLAVNFPAGPTVTSPVNINCMDSSILTAHSPDTLKWYDQATGGNLLGVGPTLNTHMLSTSTNYWVESDVPTAADYCHPYDTAGQTATNYNTAGTRYLMFSVHAPSTLMSVVTWASTAGNRTIYLWNSAGVILDSIVATLAVGRDTITLNFPLNVGDSFRLGMTTAANLMRGVGLFPYSDPNNLVSIIGSSTGGRYYYFWDWKLQGPACKSLRSEVSVNVNVPAATINAATSTTFCQGDSVLLTANTGTSYLWSNGATTQSIYANTAGNYTVTVTYAGGCFTASTPTIVNVLLAPTISICPMTGNAVVAPTTTQTYSVTNDTTVTYVWTVPNGWTIVSGQGTNSLQVTSGVAGGNVCLTAGNTCGASPGSPCCLAITMSTGIHDITSNASLNIYPNPANESLLISLNTLAKGANWNITLYDVMGNKVQTETLKTVAGDNLKELNISALSKGVYILELENNGTKLIRKVIKE